MLKILDFIEGRKVMFSNVGNKIKGVAVISFILEAIAGIIVFLYLLIDGYDFWECLIPLGSILVSLIIAWFIYGFGELVANSSSISDDVYAIKNMIVKLPLKNEMSYNIKSAGSNKPSQESVDLTSAQNMKDDIPNVLHQCPVCNYIQVLRDGKCINCGKEFNIKG